MKLFEVITLNERSQLAFLDLKKNAIKHIHNFFKLAADTPFKPVNKADAKKAIKNGELVIGFNDDGSFSALGAKDSRGTWLAGKTINGWLVTSGTADGKFDRGDYVSNAEIAYKRISKYKNIFTSVEGNFDKESSSVTFNDKGLQKLWAVEGEMFEKFDTIIKKVGKQTIDAIADEISVLLKQGKITSVEKKIKDLERIKQTVEDITGGWNKKDVLKDFMRTVYKEDSGVFLSDLGHAIEKKKMKDSKFMIKLGLFLMKKARGEEWTGKIFKGIKK